MSRTRGRRIKRLICASIAHNDSQARADQIAELRLRQPDGILRDLERAFPQDRIVTL
jgi:hypothetical protein